MKQHLYLLFTVATLVAYTAASQAQSSVFLFGVFNKEKLKQAQFMLQTFGPATITCYDQLTAEGLSMEKMQELMRNGEMQSCLQSEAAETAKNLQNIHQ